MSSDETGWSGRRVAVVTGAARGLGRAIAKRLADDGWRVLALDIVSPEDPPEGDIEYHPCDVSVEDDVRRVAAEAAERFGGVDALINNAGIADPHTGPVTELALADWEHYLRTNLTGGFLCVKHLAPLLRQRRGAVVNIASTRALQSEPHCEAYAAGKGGLLALTHALAVSLGPEIRVNAISPGWIDTAENAEALRPVDHAQHPTGRVGRPQDVAAMAGYLVSADAGFVTGQNFVCDGGMGRRMIYAE